jgi:hypothetical protein
MTGQQRRWFGLGKSVREKHNREDCDGGGDEIQSAVHNPPNPLIEALLSPCSSSDLHSNISMEFALSAMGATAFATGKADYLRVENVLPSNG